MRRAASSHTGSARGTLHSTGQLHKGGPPTGLFVQVVDDTGEEIPIPGEDFGFGRLIRAQAEGDFRSLQERGRSDRAGEIGGSVVQLGMIGLGRMGAGMTERLREAGHEVQTYDPNVDARTAGSLAAAQRATGGAARLLDDDSRGEDHRADVPRAARARRRGRHDRRRRQLELPRLEAALRRGEARRHPLRRRRSLRRCLGPRDRLLPDGRRRRRAGRAARADLHVTRARGRLRARRARPAPVTS